VATGRHGADGQPLPDASTATFLGRQPTGEHPDRWIGLAQRPDPAGIEDNTLRADRPSGLDLAE